MINDLKEWAKWLFHWWVIAVTIIVVVGWTPIARDNTDPGDWGFRSNLSPRTDSLTGCQYLTTPGGGLTPRLDVNGKHLGCSTTSKEAA